MSRRSPDKPRDELSAEMERLPYDPLTAIGALDGRYRRQAQELATYVSEYALIKYRLTIEVEWFLFLNQSHQIPNFSILDGEQIDRCRRIWRDFNLDDARQIRDIESKTNHDVKAVEYYLRQKLEGLHLGSTTEMVHFGCTSEDINNLAYGLMIRDVRDLVLLPKLSGLVEEIVELARPLVSVPMLARTHGQAASPTTAGKELAVFAARLNEWESKLRDEVLYGKMNGAVGNYNAHQAACPNIDWLGMGQTFVQLLGLQPHDCTTQIEPHDYIARVLTLIKGCNVVLLDFVRDIWSYISLGYFRQKQIEGEVGSSTMPHKVNPIDFENAEGNLGVANALLSHLAEKLPISRWQRDLSDSTALRNLGIAFGHSLHSYQSSVRGLRKLELNQSRVKEDLSGSWEVLTEAIQTVMRVEGIGNAYDKVKELTRGEQLDRESYLELLANLNLSTAAQDQLSQLTPENYTGLAETIALNTLDKIKMSRA
ncbi:MAG: adenylosuccinate lyase [Gammaproteobacteria bacterium]|nr:adenylosuccinate lyase [Gammaproteobacteria bacterium]